MSDAREEAISDCKYAKSLGEVAFQQHMSIWSGFPPGFDSPDYEYWCTLSEIQEKLETDECLLK